ncbi:hypothetical protein PMG11_06863 [Penicillium brasilianum]|uniref:C2H2-type domain-containing protein n=1 Tax=Penicillium brasilianum TaxID=104259 RepID=A0A0F7TT30_PENBI|nr:hypothetical protein PMG11_06863 [Penicillium brasilianum]
MALTPYNTRREYQSGQANQDGWEYPWTPTNNTSPVFSNPGQSVSPSLRRAVPAQVPSTPIRSNGPPIVYSPTYRAAPTPWGVNATPIAYPETMVTPQHVPWADWGHSSQGNAPPQGDLQPALSFNSVATSSNTGVDDPTPTGGEDDHRCGPASHANHHQPSQLKCQWAGCTYSGVFTRETCLWRHIKSVHVSPGMYACTYPQCNKAFGRKDKFLAHLRQAHMLPGGHCPACHP